MELMDKFSSITEKLGENPIDEEILHILKENKVLIDEISNSVKTTKMFKSASDEYEAFKLEMFSKREVSEQILFAYYQLLSKMVYAPTSLYMIGSVILLMPLLSDALKDK